MKNNDKKQQLKEELIQKLTLQILKEEYSKEQLEEFNLSGLASVAKGIGDKVADKAKQIGSDIKKDYYKGTLAPTEAKLMKQMEKVKEFILLYNERAKKAGEPLINPKKLMGVLNSIPTK